MRGTMAALGIVAGATWSVGASAQQQWGSPALPPPPSHTEQQLNASDGSGSYRRLELVYLNGEVGGGYVNVGDKFTYQANQASQGGVMFGVGAGLRFLYFTLGVRGRVAPLSAYTLWEANLEAGVHVPLGAWDPYLHIHGGYADVAMNAQPTGILNTSITPASPNGGDFGGAVGTDYYFSSLFSLGADLTLDALFLSATEAQFGAASISVSQTGLAFFGSLHAGLHFSL